MAPQRGFWQCLLLLGSLLCALAQESVTSRPALVTPAVLNPTVLDPTTIKPTTALDNETDNTAAAAAAPDLGRRGGLRAKPPRPGAPNPLVPAPPPPEASPSPSPPGSPPPSPPPQDPSTPPDFAAVNPNKCITDPEEFAKVFNEGTRTGQEARCVSDNIVVRINQDFRPLANASRQALSEGLVTGLVRATSFWSYGDNPEKYLRIGRDNLAIGNFVDNPAINNGLQDAEFSGIKSMSNFAALLEAVGYGSSSSNPKAQQMLVVTTLPDKTSTSIYEPTWVNVTTYFNHFIPNIAAQDPEALAAAGFSSGDQFRAFKIQPEVAKYLTQTTFAELTGCPATCTYQDIRYGTIGGRNGTYWQTPTKDGSRNSTRVCRPPEPARNATGYITDPNPWNPEDMVLTEPTIIDIDTQFCTNKEFQKWKTYFANRTLCPAGGIDQTANRALALRMADAYMKVTGSGEAALAQRATIFRAYLLTSCAGGFNPLFSGNGYTYTGNGGFLGATGTEIHIGEVSPKRLPEVFNKKTRLIFFCPVAPDGTPFKHAICPSSLGSFSKERLMEKFGITGSWDVAEVKHPDDKN